MRKWMREIHKKQEGFALAMALLLMTVGGLLIVPASMMINTAMNANRVIDNNDKEMYAADTGIEFAVWRLQYDSDFVLPDEGEQSSLPFSQIINDKEVDITIANEGEDGYKITSTAIDNVGQSTTIVAYVEVAEGSGSGTPGAFDHAVATLDGGIDISGNAYIYDSDGSGNANIHANGDIYMQGGDVEGNASAVGDITVTPSGNITGTQTEGADWIDPPFVDVDGYKAEASAILEPFCVNVTHGGDWAPPPGVYPDPEHVQKKLIVSGIGSWTFGDRLCVGVVEPEDLIVEGIASATFENTVKAGQDISLSTNGFVVFKDTVWIDRDLRVESNTSVVFEGPVYIGRDMDLQGNAVINFHNVVHIIGDFMTSSDTVVMLGGTVYAEGNVEMSGNSRVEGGETIVAGGDMMLSGNSKLNPEDTPFFISEAVDGEVSFSGDSWISAIVFAPECHVTLSGNNKVYGCIVSKSVIALEGNCEIEYPTDLMDNSNIPGGGGPGGDEGSITIKSYAFQ